MTKGNPPEPETRAERALREARQFELLLDQRFKLVATLYPEIIAALDGAIEPSVVIAANSVSGSSRIRDATIRTIPGVRPIEAVAAEFSARRDATLPKRGYHYLADPFELADDASLARLLMIYPILLNPLPPSQFPTTRTPVVRWRNVFLPLIPADFFLAGKVPALAILTPASCGGHTIDALARSLTMIRELDQPRENLIRFFNFHRALSALHSIPDERWRFLMSNIAPEFHDDPLDDEFVQAVQAMLRRHAVAEADRRADEIEAEVRRRVLLEVTEQITQQVTEQVTQQVTEQVTQQVTEQVTQQVTERIQEEAAERERARLLRLAARLTTPRSLARLEAIHDVAELASAIEQLLDT